MTIFVDEKGDRKEVTCILFIFFQIDAREAIKLAIRQCKQLEYATIIKCQVRT